MTAFIIFESLYFTGFCYAERRWLSEDDIRDRILGPVGEERDNGVIHLGIRPYRIFFECSYAYCRPNWYNYIEGILDQLLGKYHFIVYVVKINQYNPSEEHYAHLSVSKLNACGTEQHTIERESLDKKKSNIR